MPRGHVVAGDVIRLSAGDMVPADGRLIAATDLHVQQAALTGESLPAEKLVTGEALTARGPESPELVYLGTSVVSGTAEAVVFATGARTSFGDIVERLAARPDETEFERGTRKFGMLILQTVIFLVMFILIDTIPYWIDTRVITTAFKAEKTLTKDTVPVDVDAVLFWKVIDPQKASLG